MADRERERKRRHLRAKAKRRREEHRKEEIGELAKEHQRDPYKKGRGLLDILKIGILVVTGLILLTLLGSRLFAVSDLPADAAIAVLWVTLLQCGAILVLGGLAFAIALGIGALFDLLAQSREGLALGREIHTETQFSGVVLSELAEALVDEEEAEEGEPQDEGDDGPPPVPAD